MRSAEFNTTPFSRSTVATHSADVLRHRNSRLGSVIALGLIAAIVFSALAFGSVEVWAMSVLESITVGLIGLWITKSILDRRIHVVIPPALVPVAGLVCWGLIQSVTISSSFGARKSISMDAEASRVAAISMFFLLVLALAAGNFFTGKQRLQHLATFFAFYGLALAVFGLIQSFTWDGAFYWLRPTRATGFGPFANRDHFAGYLEMLIPFPAALIAAGSIHRERRLVYGFAATMMVIAVIASLSRGGMLSVAAEGVFITAWRLRSRSRLTSSARPRDLKGFYGFRAALSTGLIVFTFCAVGALGFAWIGADPILNKAAQTLADIRDPQNHISRQWIWNDTWAMIKAHPIAGVGIGAYETVYPMYSHSNGRMIVAQSHNDYLQVTADCGIVGGVFLILFLAALYGAMRRALRVEDRQMSGIALACSAAVIGLLIHSLFDFNLQIPSNALLFLFVTVMLSNVPAAASGRSRFQVYSQVGHEAPIPVLAGV